MNEAETRAKHIDRVLDKLKTSLLQQEFSGQLSVRTTPEGSEAISRWLSEVPMAWHVRPRRGRSAFLLRPLRGRMTR